jgi:hypothetical protein
MSITEYLDRCGWYLQYELGTGGLNLYNLRHAMYRFAHDVRIAGIWVGSEDPNKPRPKDASLVFLTLGGPDFPNSDFVAPPGKELKPPPAPFYVYKPVSGLSASFKTKDPVFGANSDSESLEITQEYQFACYGMNPPHEPGAVLRAARFFPMIRFNLSGSGKKKAKYLRVDFRFNLNLDNLGFDPEVRAQKQRSGQDIRGPNQVGIFRDNETIPFPIQIQIGGVEDFPFVRTPRLVRIGDIFAAAEKPLQYEIVTRGLTHGNPEDAGVRDTWDNFHQWPAPYPGLAFSSLPTTPGAFHCAHLHWRWGAVAGDPSLRGSLVQAAGDPQFRGPGGNGHAGGPLVDILVPDQSIQFAVTKNFNKNLDTETLSTEKFEDLFTSQHLSPEAVDKGADIVLWYSVEAFRDGSKLDEPWTGTLFIHGMYFAHEQEPFSAASIAANLSGKLQNPPPVQKWQRYAAMPPGRP